MSQIVHEVTLPSQGLLYPEYPELSDPILIRSITTKEEKMIFGSGTDLAITKALSQCIESPTPFPLSELSIPDRHFLVVAWRVLSYGSDYQAMGQCPSCNAVNEHILNIGDLVSTSSLLDEEYKEPYEIVLPESQDTLTLRHLRDKDIQEIEKQVQNVKKKLKILDESVNFHHPFQLASHIHTVNGKELNLTDKVSYVESLLGRDSSYIIHKANKMQSYGINPIVDVECKKCRSEYRFQVPADMTFFRSYFKD